MSFLLFCGAALRTVCNLLIVFKSIQKKTFQDKCFLPCCIVQMHYVALGRNTDAVNESRNNRTSKTTGLDPCKHV
jgi:hypothetical protein